MVDLQIFQWSTVDVHPVTTAQEVLQLAAQS